MIKILNGIQKNLVITAGTILLVIVGYFLFVNIKSEDVIGIFTSDVITTGTTYYIDSTSGKDTNNGTSVDTPWKSTDAVNNRTFLPGDKILLKRGSVFNSPNTMVLKGNGTSGSKITVDAYGTGSLPIISNSGSSIYDYVIRLDGSYYTISNILIDNLTYQTNVTEDGLRITGSNNSISNIEARNVGHGIAVVGASNVNISNVYVHDGQMIVNDPTPFNDYGAGGVVVMNNSSNVKVSNSRFINLMAPSYDYGTDGSAFEIYNKVSNVEFYDNYTERTDNVLEIGGSNISDVVDGIVLHHNILTDFRALAVFNNNAAAGYYGITTKNVKIDHNTAIRKNLEQGWRVLWFQTAPAANEFFVRNNIFEIDKVYGFAENYGGLAHSGNVYKLTNFNNEAMYSLDSSEKRLTDSESISFIDPANKNYILQSTSVAIDRGTFLGYSLDYSGTPLPQDSSATNKPDAGAFELIQSAATYTCGNAVVESIEVCDDGNTSDNDLCSSTCRNACTSPLTWNGFTCIAPTDTTNPTISITLPSNNSTLNKGDFLNISANAIDNIGISKVEFYNDSTLLCTDTTATYTCKYRTDRKNAATLKITAKAYDNSGNSSSVQITVTTK